VSSFSLSELMPKVKAEQVETVEGCTHEVNTVEINISLWNDHVVTLSSFLRWFFLLVRNTLL